ncbi:MAG TPA: transglutaminase domain-containing protein [Planctomycetota bacterium]
MQTTQLGVARLWCLATLLAALPAQDEKRTYAVRIDGKVVGHMTETEQQTSESGRPVLRFESKTLIKVEVFGASVDQRVDQVWILEQQTRKPLRFTCVHVTGGTTIALAGKLVDGRFELDNGGKPLDPKTVVIEPDLRWVRDRVRPGEKIEVDQLVPEVGGVQRCTAGFAKEPERLLDVMGTNTPVRVYEMSLPALGVDSVVFLRRDDYEIVRYELPAQKVVIERVPPSVVERIERVDLTDRFLVRTNLDVEDPAVLTKVKLRASIEATKDVTAAGLTAPGQVFEGTVEDGRIEGVFTITPRRHDGSGAAPFPVPDGLFAAESLQPFLVAEENIESGHAGIAAKAREVAAGASSCFEVTERLAKWVHDAVSYVIPGGVSAKRTFETRTGECGGHSRVLAAMLRSLGIPARTPMGGMYVPLFGGSFAQHMWTEVWLGDAIGWLPVDCTAGQATFIDAGHIRLSERPTNFQPKSIEVLEHEPKTKTVAAAPARTGAFPFEVGEKLEYAWSMAGKPLGKESIVYRGEKDGAHVFEAEIDLKDGAFVEKTRTHVGADGRLLSFHAEQVIGAARTTIGVTVAGTEATFTRKSGEGDRTYKERVDPSLFVLHNNCTLHFALAVDRVGALDEGAERKVRFLHTEQRSVFPMTLCAASLEEVGVGGAKASARRIDGNLLELEIVLHVDDRGRLVRFHQKKGDVRVDLVSR